MRELALIISVLVAGAPTEEPDVPVPELPFTHRGCPAEPDNAQWSTRTYYTSSLPGPDSTERWSLELDGGTAQLRFERAHFKKHAKNPEWACVDAFTLTGTRQKTNRGDELFFDPVQWRCVKETLRVAPAGAKRVTLPSIKEDCPRHRWASAKRETVNVLHCSGGAEFVVVIPSQAFFGAAPGVERLVLEADDCGPGDLLFEPLRRIPGDGGVLPGH